MSRIKQLSPYLKIGFIIFLVLLFLIPYNSIRGLIYERENLQMQAINEVSGSWGSQQVISGIVLTIPVEITRKNSDNSEYTRIENHHFLPVKLEYTANLKHEQRKRSIYEVQLYKSQLRALGAFDVDSELLQSEGAKIRWADAVASIGISDPAAIESASQLNWGGKEYGIQPGSKIVQMMPKGLHVELDGTEVGALDFDFELTFKGSTALMFDPTAENMTVQMTSDWHSPSFIGRSLPEAHDIQKTGFTSSWKTSIYNKTYASHWKGDAMGFNQRSAYINVNPRYNNKEIDRGANLFGVNFIQPVNHYSKNHRAIKFSMMIILLSFCCYYFFELIYKFKLHPVQYALIGFALLIFYLLLLSLSEHIGFDKSYFLAGFATISLIISYSASILKNRTGLIFLAGVLIMLYLYIYVLLQMEDYALLAGSIGLFVILAVVMYVSKKIDWFNLIEEENKA